MEKERKQITLRVDEELWERLREESEQVHVTMTELINIILFQHFQNIAQE